MSKLILYKGAVPDSPDNEQVAVFVGYDGKVYAKDEFGNTTVLSNENAIAIAEHESKLNPHPQYVLKTYVEKVEYFTLTTNDISSKSLELEFTPLTPSNVKIDIKNGGGPLFYDEDFTVMGKIVTWNGKDPETILTSGDKLRIIYTHEGL